MWLSCGYSIFSDFVYDNAVNKCWKLIVNIMNVKAMIECCKSLKEHVLKISDFKTKKTYQLTIDEYELHGSQQSVMYVEKTWWKR